MTRQSAVHISQGNMADKVTNCNFKCNYLSQDRSCIVLRHLCQRARFTFIHRYMSQVMTCVLLHYYQFVRITFVSWNTYLIQGVSFIWRHSCLTEGVSPVSRHCCLSEGNTAGFSATVVSVSLTLSMNCCNARQRKAINFKVRRTCVKQLTILQ